jgi:hypothetical protein
MSNKSDPLNLFHVEDNDSKKSKISWGKLDIDTRVEKLEDFFKLNFNNDNTKKTIDKKTVETLINLAKTGKLKLKKEVQYDETNQRIIKITGLINEQHTNKYIYKSELLTQREKSRKSAKSRLFRKKK